MTEPEQVIYAVAYARVSTKDTDQNPESQLLAIRNWAKSKGGIRIVREFSDKSTGTNTDRDGYYMMKGFIQENRKVSMVIALDADRMSRNMDDTAKMMKDFNDLGVRLIYTTNETIDVSTAEGKLMNTFLSYGAQNYTDHLGDKIRAGMERARQEGKQIGRPLSRVNQFNIDLILGYASMGYSLRDVATIHRCSRVTLTNRLKDEGKLDDFKRIYKDAISSGKVGPALATRKYNPKKSTADSKQTETDESTLNA